MENKINYTAIITLNPVEGDSKIGVNVTLQPTDLLNIDDVVTTLGDCTLEQLQRYGVDLEKQVSKLIGQIKLRDLVLIEQIKLNVESAPTETGTTDHDLSDWLDQQIILRSPETEETEEAPISEIQVAEVQNNLPVSAHPTEPVMDISPTEQIHEQKTAVTTKTDEEMGKTHSGRTMGKMLAYYQANAVHVFLDESPFAEMKKHSLTSMEREVAGVMIGKLPELQPDGRYLVHVSDMIIAKHTRMSGASVTYTPESWRYLNDQLEANYPHGDMVMLGWYHTHPGFGIFLSNMDLFIHTNFFTQPWHIAYVLDPHAHRSGFFSWDDEQKKVIPYPFSWPDWAARSW